ncbi:hypothetical protein HY449_04300 [Candidatus Pacearchaeota archaeon]|nr:hypothetical protein [Candidatus Pacearchaeota archaeon]
METDYKKEYVHQLNAPTEPYKIDKKSSGDNLFYLETLQLNESTGLRTRIYLGEDGKVARILMTPVGITNADGGLRSFKYLIYPNTKIKRDNKGNYNSVLEDENGDMFCIEDKCAFPVDVSQYQKLVDSYKIKLK